jgi:hypothetical protein
MFGTKTDEGKRSHESLKTLVDRAFKLRREKRAGYPRPEHLMANLEFETYLIVDQLCEYEEIGRQNDLLAYVRAGFQIETR